MLTNKEIMEEKVLQPQSDHLSIEDEFKMVADGIKENLSLGHSISAVTSMNVKAMIFPPALKKSFFMIHHYNIRKVL